MFPQLQGEVALYADFASKIMAGQLPYTGSFVPEYPPLALVFFTLPLLIINGPFYYTFIFKTILIVCLTITFLLIAKLNFKKALLFALLVITLHLSPYSLVLDRFDVIPMFLTFLSVYFFRDKKVLSYNLLAFATLTKIFPGILLLYYLWKDRSLKLFSVFLFWIVLFSFPLYKSLEYHQNRGLQIESSYNFALIFLPEGLVRPEYSSASWNMASTNLEPYFIPIMLFTILLAFIKVARSGVSRFQAAFYLILSFILSNKVFSPQFLIWLFPFVVFLNRPTLIAIFFAATLLTSWYFNYYESVVRLESLMPVVRNLLLWFTFLA